MARYEMAIREIAPASSAAMRLLAGPEPRHQVVRYFQIASAASAQLHAGFHFAMEVRTARDEQAMLFREFQVQVGILHVVVAVISLDRVKPGGAQLRHQIGYVAVHADRVRQRGHSAGLPDSLDGLGELRFAAVYV